ncbi:NTP transferase domain-containing protein [Microbacterium sp. LRZ72]|uniref:nucleotidyltransferase family protein n=1 Tax=Microbacterium sp. LRZ72 TaxID=2942481 RepID=UPI0029A07F7A|nr:NTP transferase domain-containing protein [Microbacterium sp. LRZ72]MDX2376316.1 NTP transferase domain-containing protein [Microbacterium sp. LRZ72]
MSESAPSCCGLVLAAGAGTRFGGPKALARDDAGRPWLSHAVEMLGAAGADPVLVALGAEADAAARLLPVSDGVRVVRVPRWRSGLAASLRAGLSAFARTGADLLVITPVDTPDAPAAAVTRVREAVRDAGETALAQAVYRGRPGHPVIVGRSHVDALVRVLEGDRGARDYLSAHGARQIECGDLWAGDDIDVRRPGR